ncbi:MAG: hypothetical protein V1858_00260 [Candidatus Gottesmanbacteria bacterium]
MKKINELITNIVNQCVALKNKYTNLEFLQIDYVCIFSHYQEEYNDFLKKASSIGKIVSETESGPIFKFNEPLSTAAGCPKVLKIRKPDPTRPQLGDVDFITDYQKFKEKYLDNRRFRLIQRTNFEMIELRDDTYKVLVYFSNIPPSRQFGIT